MVGSCIADTKINIRSKCMFHRKKRFGGFKKRRGHGFKSRRRKGARIAKYGASRGGIRL